MVFNDIRCEEQAQKQGMVVEAYQIDFSQDVLQIHSRLCLYMMCDRLLNHELAIT